jgi:cyclopropane-fatty-acyl-phospholipid synthase
MEDIKREVKLYKRTGLYEKIVLSLFEKFKKGTLKVILPSQEVLFFGDGVGFNADITIKNRAFFKKCTLYADIGFGESFCDGDWSTTDLTILIKFIIDNIETSGIMSGSTSKNLMINILGGINKVRHVFNKNTKTKSLENISYHYDLSNEFYQLMLDESMSYSCGIFENKNFTLHQAQINKLNKICVDLDLKKTDHVLEIGCGWGGFAIHAVQNYGCKVTGVTISKEQYNFAKRKIRALGLESYIEILLMDYRDIEGDFNKIVSIEMIEAVGDEYMDNYFKTIDRLLKKDGLVVIQAITSPDSRYRSFVKGVDFIQKHIFPGSLLPSIGKMVSSCQNTELQIMNLRDIGFHYGKTLRHWWNAVMKNKDRIRGLGMNEMFFKKWEYYICYCEAAFTQRNISTVQLVLTRPNNTKAYLKES